MIIRVQSIQEYLKYLPNVYKSDARGVIDSETADFFPL